ncbi:MAG: hypothetical protein HRT69_11615 [Flavobacteriaceae bacterium]|nr:hypothetical protein [Flavobacteriaceae bacterium]
MWDINTIWFEIAIVSSTMSLGYICLGHFEERTPSLRKFFKYVFTLAIVIAISIFFGQKIALIIFGLMTIPALYIHLVWLPKKGIHGWTGKPKSKYYELRKWSKNIFDEK